MRSGTLTAFIEKTFSDIGKAHYEILNQHRARNTTIQPSLFEIFVGKLIKHLLEERLKSEGIEVLLDSYLLLNSRKIYPDIQIRKNGQLVGIIELKHTLKRIPYERTERIRRNQFLAQIETLRTYSIILYAIYDETAISSIVADQADWVYIIRYEQSAGRFKDRSTIPFPHRPNPVELALNEIINA